MNDAVRSALRVRPPTKYTPDAVRLINNLNPFYQCPEIFVPIAVKDYILCPGEDCEPGRKNLSGFIAI